MIGKLERERAGSESSPGLIESRRDAIKSYSRLTFLVLAGLVTIAAAQGNADHEDPVSGEPLTCYSISSASRTRAGCSVDGEKEPTVLRTEKELTISEVVAAPDSPQCEAELALEYLQWEAIARVEGMINNETCAASNGQYEIAARVRDQNGEIKTLEFSESWQRDDDQPVMFTADYPIGEKVELVRLNARRLRCTCIDAIEE